MIHLTSVVTASILALSAITSATAGLSSKETIRSLFQAHGKNPVFIECIALGLESERKRQKKADQLNLSAKDQAQILTRCASRIQQIDT